MQMKPKVIATVSPALKGDGDLSAAVAVVMVMAALAPATPGVTAPGEKVHVAPGGVFAQESATGLLEPCTAEDTSTPTRKSGARWEPRGCATQASTVCGLRVTKLARQLWDNGVESISKTPASKITEHGKNPAQ